MVSREGVPILRVIRVVLYKRTFRTFTRQFMLCLELLLFSVSDGGMDVTDLDVVEMRTAKLSNEGAKHRISVKPKSRRASTKTTSMKHKEV